MGSLEHCAPNRRPWSKLSVIHKPRGRGLIEESPLDLPDDEDTLTRRRERDPVGRVAAHGDRRAQSRRSAAEPRLRVRRELFRPERRLSASRSFTSTSRFFPVSHSKCSDSFRKQKDHHPAR